MAHSHAIRNSGIALFISIAVILCMGIAAAPAKAEQEQGPCAGDLQKFCKGVEPGGGRIAACFKEHEKDLSPACKRQIAELVHEFQEACEDDVMKLCSGIKPGGGRIFRCLKQHEGELSPECKEKMEAHPKH
ncbi:MAG TPA: cysteine rich repeat-containing protein [Nitrospirota bacterium]|nr:cysteine rich repeat-containing protein [Nitrospirota bacterium]